LGCSPLKALGGEVAAAATPCKAATGTLIEPSCCFGREPVCFTQLAPLQLYQKEILNLTGSWLALKERERVVERRKKKTKQSLNKPFFLEMANRESKDEGHKLTK